MKKCLLQYNEISLVSTIRYGGWSGLDDN